MFLLFAVDRVPHRRRVCQLVVLVVARFYIDVDSNTVSGEPEPELHELVTAAARRQEIDGESQCAIRQLTLYRLCCRVCILSDSMPVFSSPIRGRISYSMTDAKAQLVAHSASFEPFSTTG